MKTFKEFINQDSLKDSSLLDEEPLEEGFVSGAVISAKLNTLKKQVLQEDDPKKQNDILAEMLHIGIGTIALVTNNRRKRF